MSEKQNKAKELAGEALAQLSAQLAAGNSEALTRWLNTMAVFHSYSMGNQLLIAFQCPHATRVAGFRAWLKIGRAVRKGEKGIAILAPIVYRSKEGADTQGADDEDKAARIFFKTVYVFDISQTEGEDLPELANISGEPGELLEALESLIRASGIDLEESDKLGSAMGAAGNGKILIRPDLGPADRFATLAHELAHAFLHVGERRHETTKQKRELEAEAVSYAVCRAVGLECATASADYIKLYDGSAEALAESLGVIRDTAARIIDGITADAPADLGGLDGKPVDADAGELVAA